MKRNASKRKEKAIRKKILVASALTGLISASVILSACTFGRCPYLGRFEYAIAFFVLGFAMSYAIKTTMLSGMAGGNKQKKTRVPAR